MKLICKAKNKKKTILWLFYINNKNTIYIKAKNVSGKGEVITLGTVQLDEDLFLNLTYLGGFKDEINNT